jgi:hypothetical protein
LADEDSGDDGRTVSTRGLALRMTAALIAVVPFALIAGFVVGSIVHGLFGLPEADQGTPLSNIFVYTAFGGVFAAMMYWVQWLSLRKVVPVGASWIVRGALGFAITEALVGIVLWPMGILRVTLGTVQGGPHEPEALILAICGGLAGGLQAPVLDRHVASHRSWPVWSAIAWGGGGLLMFSLPMIFVGTAVMALVSAYAIGRLR